MISMTANNAFLFFFKEKIIFIYNINKVPSLVWDIYMYVCVCARIRTCV